jgi:O-antigen/teichoic acid export membrane protein
MNTVQRVATNTGFIMVGDLIFRLISLVVTIYLARFLGTVGFGKYSLVFAYLTFFGIITDLGLQNILVREMSRDPSASPKLIGNAYFIRVILTVLGFVLSIIVISLMSYPADTTTYVYIAAFTLLFISFSDFYATIFQANLKMQYRETAKLAFKIISASLIIWIIFSQGTLMQVIIVLVFSEMVKTLISFLFSRKLVKPRFEIDFELWRYLFKESFPIALSSIIWVIYFRIDVIMLSMMMGDIEVGLYSAAYKLSEPLSLIPAALMMSIFPIMSASFKTSEERLVRSYKLSFKYLLIITLPIAVSVSLLSDKIIFLVYGTEFAGSAPALQILIWGLVFTSGGAIFGTLLTSMGKQNLGAYITALCAFGNITLNFILIPILGYVGASIASVITALLAFILGFYFVSKNLRVPPLHSVSLKPVAASLIMGAFVYFFNTNIFLLIFCAAAIYLISLLFLKTFTEEDIDLIGRVIGRDVHWILSWKSLIKKVIKKK